MGDVCINVAGSPQCHLVNQPLGGKADKDADRAYRCIFVSVGLYIIVLPGNLEVCVPAEEESLVFAGLTGAVLITVMGAQ